MYTCVSSNRDDDDDEDEATTTTTATSDTAIHANTHKARILHKCRKFPSFLMCLSSTFFILDHTDSNSRSVCVRARQLASANVLSNRISFNSRPMYRPFR